MKFYYFTMKIVLRETDKNDSEKEQKFCHQRQIRDLII